MKVRVVSELTAVRKCRLVLSSMTIIINAIVFTYAIINQAFTAGQEFECNVLCFTMLFLLPYLLLKKVFYFLTIRDDSVSVCFGAQSGFPEKIKLNENKDVYIKGTEYREGRGRLQNGILISSVPIDEENRNKRNEMIIVYSERFIKALEENCNLHIQGEIPEEVNFL